MKTKRTRKTAPERTVQKVNLDLPIELLRRIDAEADRIGVPRQSFIKLRLADMLDATRKQEPQS